MCCQLPAIRPSVKAEKNVYHIISTKQLYGRRTEINLRKVFGIRIANRALVTPSPLARLRFRGSSPISPLVLKLPSLVNALQQLQQQQQRIIGRLNIFKWRHTFKAF